jgi:hypothetical protein
MPDLPVSLDAFRLALFARRYDGDVLVRFRNGEPILARLVESDAITLRSPADGRCQADPARQAKPTP